MNIKADFTKITGRIKPMHGIGQPPVMGLRDRFFHYLGEAGIPYSRLHDVGGQFGGARFVDIPNIFPNFDADETLPESYDFTFTDWLIERLMAQRCEPFFRLGVTIENFCDVKIYHIRPPKDFAKWARVCEHVIRHYNEGWADGFRFGIKYWEIWAEPEGHVDGGHSQLWAGTQEEYFRLYEITANHLKKCFGDSIRVGGYAAIGWYACDADPECRGVEHPASTREYYLTYGHEFLDYIASEAHKSPLDFFSWHSYSGVDEIMKQEDYCRRMLEKHGFGDVEDILNEWNNFHTIQDRGTPRAAAGALAVMLAMQKKPVGLLAYYDGRIGPSEYGGLFNPDTWAPYLTYFAFMSFNRAYELGDEVQTASDDGKVFVLGATDGEKQLLLLSNTGERPVEAAFDIIGADTSRAEILMIDDVYHYSPTGKRIVDGRLVLPACSCTEIRMGRMQ